MTENNRPGFRFGLRDLLLIVTLALIGVIPLAVMLNMRGSEDGARTEAVLTVAGVEVWRCAIHDGMEPEEYSAKIDGQFFTVIADPTGAYVRHSDCPDQICVETGRISTVGQTVVCVPLRAVLRIDFVDTDEAGVTDSRSAVDAVSG